MEVFQLWTFQIRKVTEFCSLIQCCKGSEIPVSSLELYTIHMTGTLLWFHTIIMWLSQGYHMTTTIVSRLCTVRGAGEAPSQYLQPSNREVVNSAWDRACNHTRYHGNGASCTLTQTSCAPDCSNRIPWLCVNRQHLLATQTPTQTLALYCVTGQATNCWCSEWSHWDNTGVWDKRDIALALKRFHPSSVTSPTSPWTDYHLFMWWQ